MQQRFKAAELERFTARILERVGLPDADASQVARLMIMADLRGVDGHGIIRLPRYVRRIRAGGVNVRPKIRLVEDRLSTALIDGDNDHPLYTPGLPVEPHVPEEVFEL